MKFRYLIIDSLIWGKNELSKDYFVGAVQRDAFIIDLEENKYFDKDENAWKDIEGDKK